MTTAPITDIGNYIYAVKYIPGIYVSPVSVFDLLNKELLGSRVCLTIIACSVHTFLMLCQKSLLIAFVRWGYYCEPGKWGNLNGYRAHGQRKDSFIP